MVPGAPLFLSETVAKAKKKREIVRIFAISVLSSIFIALSSGQGLAAVPWFVLIDGFPLGVMLILALHMISRVRMPSAGLAFLFHSVVYTALFAAAIALAFFSVVPRLDFVRLFRSNSRIVILVLALSYVQVLLITSIRGVARKLGPGTFWKWLRGYYYTPKEEERIFMFLDLRRSTELAESLGDLRFSRLVRDFFEDLTGPIVETGAEVSHYIGDEAVLTWRPDHGLPDARCLQCFFRMQAIIHRRRSHYLGEYALVPAFKAGAHIGRVVATEVGTIKSEIVFHGDVLNTTARVQGACAEHGSDLLITEPLAARLPRVSWLSLQPIGAVALKGKSERVPLLSASVRLE
jgi:adenylate cyclase